MTDLVKRLREQELSNDLPMDGLLDEAADEVERLRAALAHPDCHDAYATDAGNCAPGCPACAALKE